jgi:hypothetical protein
MTVYVGATPIKGDTVISSIFKQYFIDIEKGQNNSNTV